MASIKQFFVREKANAGTVVRFGFPVEGWLRVRGVDSDAFRMAEVEERRQLLKLAEIKDADERKQAINENSREWELRMMASVVCEWGFDEPCTPANVIELLREAPYVLDKVKEVVENRARFFVSESATSSDSPSTSSDRTSESKEAQSQSENT